MWVRGSSSTPTSRRPVDTPTPTSSSTTSPCRASTRSSCATARRFSVKDNGSLNGTYFDGVRIDEALLTDGAEVQVGKFRLTFYASRVDLARLANA